MTSGDLDWESFAVHFVASDPSRVKIALRNGHLAPLADYLEVGGRIDDELRAQLIDMIREEGSERYRLCSIGRKKGEEGTLADAARDHRDIVLGIAVEQALRANQALSPDQRLRRKQVIGGIVVQFASKFKGDRGPLTDRIVEAAGEKVRRLLGGRAETCGLKLDPSLWVAIVRDAFPES